MVFDGIGKKIEINVGIISRYVVKSFAKTWVQTWIKSFFRT